MYADSPWHCARRATLASRLALIALLAAGCGDKTPAGPAGGNAGEFRAVLDAGGDFETVVPQEMQTVTDQAEEMRPDGTRWLCTTRHISSVQAPLEYATFDPLAEVLYPGSLLQGATLPNATPDPIAVRRAAGTISIDLNNGSEGVSVTVPEVRQSTIREAMNEILRNNTGVGAARFVFESHEVQSVEQLAASIGVNVQTLTSSFRGRLAFNTDRQYNRWVVRLHQTYYTMSYDLPTSLGEVFAASVTPQDLDPYVGPGNPAAYVSSVTFGRIFYLLIETTSSREQLEASVEATYRTAIAGGGLDAGTRYVRDLDEVRIKVFALGGNPELALDTFNGDFERVRTFLTTGGDVYTGRPLSYVVRAVRDNRSVFVKVATEYDVRECIPVDASLPNPIVWYSGFHGVDTVPDVGARRVVRWQDHWGNPDMAAVQAWGEAPTGYYFENHVNGRGHSISFQLHGWLRFPGLRFRDTDYTIFVLARKFSEPGGEIPSDFVWGRFREPGQGLRLGFKDDHIVHMSHGDGLTLEATAPGFVQGEFFLYTFRFSQTEGMAIYVNGLLRGSDPTLTTPLAGFTGASLGTGASSSLNVSVSIAEMKAVGVALSDADRSRVENEIMLLYGL